MPVKIEEREVLKEKEMKESSTSGYSFVGLEESESESESESEMKWLRLHQMFDK